MNRAEQTHESFHFKKRGEAKIVRLTSQHNEETANAWDRTGPNRTEPQWNEFGYSLTRGIGR